MLSTWASSSKPDFGFCIWHFQLHASSFIAAFTTGNRVHRPRKNFMQGSGGPHYCSITNAVFYGMRLLALRWLKKAFWFPYLVYLEEKQLVILCRLPSHLTLKSRKNAVEAEIHESFKFRNILTRQDYSCPAIATWVNSNPVCACQKNYFEPP